MTFSLLKDKKNWLDENYTGKFWPSEQSFYMTNLFFRKESPYLMDRFFAPFCSLLFFFCSSRSLNTQFKKKFNLQFFNIYTTDPFCSIPFYATCFLKIKKITLQTILMIPLHVLSVAQQQTFWKICLLLPKYIFLGLQTIKWNETMINASNFKFSWGRCNYSGRRVNNKVF